ncbi:cytochrome P450 monooxygenase-like protein [Polychaeton citri CBS 116435]|uniref:Cytochrome P450 monooxygenase-like protein n=1 Tax=Polychaeton citri CBS 116435 TaxID=1314669 RepID=A0A9P4QD58_9PEZI|nr:cytochrome P450 monooxygenase-like protein [Polychaeton citri CBS 116435]
MVSFLGLAALGLSALYLVHYYRCFQANLAAAKTSGFPYICLPVYTYNRFWLVTHRLWLPFIDVLPKSWTQKWRPFIVPEFPWAQLYDCFRELNSDCFLLVAPGANTLWVADAEATAQMTSRRNDFPKPTHLYGSVDIFGKNVVSTEGAMWRHHRKITSPPFNEQSNRVVWTESLHQGQCMMASWIDKDQKTTGALKDVAAQAMRLSLHVISRAGFGVRLAWPHEEGDEKPSPGHTLTYKDALSGLLDNIITVMLTPRWLLENSPFELHKVAWESFREWGQYMREMYNAKLQEVRSGEIREGMDLMGALVKGAGITSESLRENGKVGSEKGATPSKKQLITDDEIFGNAFVFILAGHETAANTIHFSTLYLAMNPSSQRHLQQDLDKVLGDKPVSQWDYDEDMPKLFGSMCGAVMNEELRLIAPVVGIPKSTPEGQPQGIQLNGQHYTVPGGSYVTISTAATHRNPKYWPHTSIEDLEEFRPERWLLDETKGANGAFGSDDKAYQEEEGMEFDQTDKRPDTAASLFRPARGAYIPFSDGYRSCLGRRFAQVEILAVLAVMFKSWTVELDVSEWLSDEEFESATEAERRAAWEKARARANWLLRNGMMTIITIQMRKDKVPLRFVRRGEERFKNY